MCLFVVEVLIYSYKLEIIIQIIWNVSPDDESLGVGRTGSVLLDEQMTKVSISPKMKLMIILFTLSEVH